MFSHGRSGLERWALGSAAETVERHANNGFDLAKRSGLMRIPSMFTKLLIPLDGSKAAEQVLPYARLFAAMLQNPVEFIAIIDSVGLAADLTESGRERDEFNALVGEVVRKSNDYLSAVSKTFEGVASDCVVEEGVPAELIIRRGEREPGMVIAMTTHGRSGVHRWLLGSVVEKVLRATANPLLLIRADEQSRTEIEASLKSIVVPLDGSELAESVLPTVKELAKKMNLAVILLRAYTISATAFMYGHGYHAWDLHRVKTNAHEYLERKAVELRDSGVAAVSWVAREGLSADAVIKMASETVEPLIVMCSRGRSGVSRWTLGSVTETVVRHVSSPVLVLRAG